ncbi:hypothetical protein [Streptomyces sp. HM190]|uniref:hypothetical protein n=1 Tax=Streptomyces sp. HM190 TaxID=2695266 RepID=UPI0013576646|nr:hypothetical protein [Streptomyces sp. HM190]
MNADARVRRERHRPEAGTWKASADAIAFHGQDPTGTATYDGYWRIAFAGTTITVPVNATGDHVDVK